MATIASLVIEIGANASGVRRELDRANQTLNAFANSAQQSFKKALGGFGGGKITGAEAAESIATSLRQTLDTRLADVRESLFRGILTPSAAAKAANEAGTAYNAALLTSISSLRTAGIVPQSVLNEMINQLRKTGLISGKELVSGLQQSLATNLAGIKEKTFAGLLSPLEAKQAAIQAGNAYNTALLQSISSLRSAGIVPQSILNDMTSQLKNTGVVSGKELASGLQQSLATNLAAIKEKTFAGLLTPIEAKKAAIDAGKSYNSSLLQSISTLRAAGIVPQAVLNDMVGQLKKTGTLSGRELASGLKQELDNKLSGIKENLFRGIINPTQAAKASKEAGAAFNSGLLNEIASLRASKAIPDSVLNDMVSQLRSTGEKAGSEGAGQLIKSFGEGMKAFGTTLTQYVTAPLLGAAGTSSKFAGEAEIAGDRLRIVWGPMAGVINTAIDGLHTKIPATITELQNMTAITSELLLPLGIVPDKVAEMTINLVGLSKSLSILNNVSPERAMNALQSALVGLNRPLKLLGILVDDDSVKLAAQNLGLIKHGETMTEVVKAQARYAVVMERSGLVVDAAERLTGTFLVQMRFLTRDVKEAAIALGAQLNPALLPLIALIRGAINHFQEFSPHTKKLIVAIGLMAASIGPLLVAGGSLLFFIGLATTALTTLSTVGFGALLVTLGPIVVAILGVAAAIGFMIGAMDAASGSLGKFQNQAKELDRTQVNRAVNANLTEQIKLMAERDRLLQKPQTVDTKIQTFEGGIAHTKISQTPTADGRQVAAINKVLLDRKDIAQALGERMKVLNKIDADGATETERWNLQMKQFRENMAKVDGSKGALKAMRDEISAIVDRLQLFRELNLDITDPLAEAQARYKTILDSVGGIDHIHQLSVEKLRVALQLQRAIGDAVEERNKAPTKLAQTALADLQDRKAEVIQTGGQIPVESLRTAYAAALKSLQALEETNRALGDKAPASGLRAAVKIRNELTGSFEQFAAGVEVALDKGIQDLTEVITTARQRGINKFFKDIADIHVSNQERTSNLKAQFGKGPTGFADVAAGALDLLKSAALGVAEGFTPLGLLARFIGKALEPLAPALEAFLLPIDIVAKVIGTALIPILRTLFPVIKFVAIALTIVGQVMYTVTSFILRAVGSLVRGLGRLINKLPGSPGDPLVKAGQALLDLADDYTESAKEMARARKEIENLTFDDAMKAVNGLAKAANDASQNIPQIFKLARSVFEAANPVDKAIRPASAPSIPSGSPTGGGITTTGRPTGEAPVIRQDTYNIAISGTNKTAAQLYREFTAEAERQRLIMTGSTQTDQFV